MAIITPSMGAKGIYYLASPFPDITTKVYQCNAIRSFTDYLDLGQSAWDAVYNPNGLTEADFKSDQAAGAHIVTLTSDNGPTIQVPDTYITRYPDYEYVPYSNIVISAALGSVPDDMSLELLQQQVAGVISDTIGVTPIVRIHVVSSSGVVSMAQHELMEQARLASITNRMTDRARYLKVLAEKTALENQLTALQNAVIQQQP